MVLPSHGRDDWTVNVEASLRTCEKRNNHSRYSSSKTRRRQMGVGRSCERIVQRTTSRDDRGHVVNRDHKLRKRLSHHKQTPHLGQCSTRAPGKTRFCAEIAGSLALVHGSRHYCPVRSCCNGFNLRHLKHTPNTCHENDCCSDTSGTPGQNERRTVTRAEARDEPV